MQRQDPSTGIPPGAATDKPISSPRTSVEAYLLLEMARTDRNVCDFRTKLANELVRHSAVTLKYNCLQLQKVKDDLHDANHHVGRVRLLIRESGLAVSAHALCDFELPVACADRSSKCYLIIRIQDLPYSIVTSSG